MKSTLRRFSSQSLYEDRRRLRCGTHRGLDGQFALRRFLPNCKVGTVLPSKFHPARDAAAALGAGLLFAWLAWLASRGAPPGFDTAGRDAGPALRRPWLTLGKKAASPTCGGWGAWPGG